MALRQRGASGQWVYMMRGMQVDLEMRQGAGRPFGACARRKKTRLRACSARGLSPWQQNGIENGLVMHVSGEKTMTGWCHGARGGGLVCLGTARRRVRYQTGVIALN